MNGKSFIKNILLLIMFLISCVFLLTNPQSFFGIGTRPLFIPLTLSLNHLLISKRNSSNKFLKICFVLLTILNSLWFIYHTYELISHYLKWNDMEFDIHYLYLICISITFFTSLPDLKKETNSINDILTIITTILIILIHYRYYLDKNLLHNLIHLSYNATSLQNRFTYITQYYPTFITMYTFLFLHKKIMQKK